MNYRHIYHAGNFADVLKHAVLARIIVYMQRKEAAFRILDTHAGTGVYDLSSDEARRTGEWQGGIGRLLAARLNPEAAGLLAPYLTAVRSLNPSGTLSVYPGSPKLARLLMRPQDRLSALELHPQDFDRLKRLFAGDYQVRVTHLDGWLALKSHLPPKEKRGLVLVDPPFEAEGEFERLADGLSEAVRRFATGTYCLWYPLKRGAPVGQFHERLAGSGITRVLRCELNVRDERPSNGLCGSGLIVVNPPFTLAGELAIVLPELTRVLAEDRGASWRCDWLAAEGDASDGA